MKSLFVVREKTNHKKQTSISLTKKKEELFSKICAMCRMKVFILREIV